MRLCKPELSRGDWESWIWRDPKARLSCGEREERDEGEGLGFPCWELGFEDGAEYEDDDGAVWVCEGKMDMKILEGKGWGFRWGCSSIPLYQTK